MQEKVDILILSRNRSFSLGMCIASIREFTKWPYRIIVSDHNSDYEERLHIAQLRGPDCDVFYVKQFLSCNEGRRFGLKLLSSPYVLFLDDDIRVGKHWLTKMMEVMLTSKKIGAVTCNLIHDYDRRESGVRYIENGYIQRHEWGYNGEGKACLGGATLYRREALEALEFKPVYNGGYEDWDATLQITQKLGYKIFGSDAGVIHLHQDINNEDYVFDRWRWSELLEAAEAIYKEWGIKSALRSVLIDCMKRGINVNKRYWNLAGDIGI